MYFVKNIADNIFVLLDLMKLRQTSISTFAHPSLFNNVTFFISVAKLFRSVNSIS